MGWIGDMFVIRFQRVTDDGSFNVLRSKERLQLSNQILGKTSLVRDREP